MCNGVDTFELVEPKAGENRICIAMTKCNRNEFQLKAGTTTTNRICEAIAPTCNPGTQYEASPPTKTSDRSCKSLSPICDEATQWEAMAAGATHDRRCADLTVCKATEYQSAAPTNSSDRVCTAQTLCDFPREYEARAANTTMDRICQEVRGPCDQQDTVREIPATPTSDKICISSFGCSGLAQYKVKVRVHTLVPVARFEAGTAEP